MELELVSIKESSQGCRGSGRQERRRRRRRLIIQMGYDYHSAGVPPSWSAARRPTVITNRGWRICSSEGAPSCDEMNPISSFNFRKRGRRAIPYDPSSPPGFRCSLGESVRKLVGVVA